MTINKIIFLIIALISLTLGTIGIFFPVLPTVPLYLLATFCFAKSSDRLHNWFLETKLYKKYVHPYKQAGGITKKAKLIIIIGVSLQIFIAAYLTRKIITALIIIGLLYLGFLISMIFIVKTIKSKDKKIS